MNNYLNIQTVNFTFTELAKDYFCKSGHQVLGGIISPVHDLYGKKVRKFHHSLNLPQFYMNHNRASFLLCTGSLWLNLQFNLLIGFIPLIGKHNKRVGPELQLASIFTRFVTFPLELHQFNDAVFYFRELFMK